MQLKHSYGTIQENKTQSPLNREVLHDVDKNLDVKIMYHKPNRTWICQCWSRRALRKACLLQGVIQINDPLS